MRSNPFLIKLSIFPKKLCLIFLILIAGCQNQSSEIVQSETPKPVIVDVDMAHEDMFSTLFLLMHPKVDVKAITVSATGEAHCEAGVSHALGIVALGGQENIPVACGREIPLAGDHAFPSTWRQNADNAYGIHITPVGEESSLNAPDLMIETIQTLDEMVTIVAVGPLTNLAEALQNNPDIRTNIEMIYVMGGAIKRQGNVGVSGVGIDNEFAEWNIYIDPYAAKIVFESGVPITLVPLDATKNVPVTHDFYTTLGEHQNTPAANLVYEMLTANLDLIGCCGFEFWDSLTAAISTDESLAGMKNLS